LLPFELRKIINFPRAFPMKTAEIGKQDQKKRSKLRGWKWWLLIATGFVVVAGPIAWGAFRYYPKWRQDRLVRRARVFIKWNDYNDAALTIKRVLQLNERNVAATALMAEMMDSANAPQALRWYRRLVELEPERLENHLDLAERALALGKPEIARSALTPVVQQGVRSGRYQDLIGQLAALSNENDKAEAAFATALKLEPQNFVFRYNQAVFHLSHGGAPMAEEARATIESCLSQPALVARAARVLIGDAVRRKNARQALSFADSLRKRPEATFQDRLQYIDLLYAFKSPKYTSYLTELQEEAVRDPAKLYALIHWLNAHNGALVAIEWSKRLPSEVITTMPVPVVLAEAYATLSDWAGLKPFVEIPEEAPEVSSAKPARPSASSVPTENSPGWAAYDYMRLALLARAEREQGKLKESKIHWIAAVKAAGRRVEAVTVLAQVAIAWGWENESTELLWSVARLSSESRWALEALYRRYVATGATRNLVQVLSRVHEIEPSDLSALNNLASFSLLSEDTTAQGIKYAEELYQREPHNPGYAATYAYALHLQGRTAEGVKLMESLGEEILTKPDYAAYYGVLLAGAGEREQARRWLALGSKASLLPEERALVDEALAKINRP
jgi:tetratricopeptide (TPR) repeat protein